MPRLHVVPSISVRDFVKSIEDKLDALPTGTNDLSLDLELESDAEREVCYLIQSLLTHEPTVGPIDRCTVLDEGEFGRVKLHLRRVAREDEDNDWFALGSRPDLESEAFGMGYEKTFNAMQRLLDPSVSLADAWRELKELRRRRAQGDPWEREMVDLARLLEEKKKP